MISRPARDRCVDMVTDGRGRRALGVVTGGRAPADPALAAGAYLEPTVVADAAPGSAIVEQESSGPC